MKKGKKMKVFVWIGFSLMCVLGATEINCSESAPTPCQNGQCNMSKQDENILKAINHLDKACILSQSIQDKEVQEAVANQLRACQNCLKRDYLSKNYDNVIEASTALHENLDEILSDCEDNLVRENITHCVNNMMNSIEG
jgi:hypothetical protein